MFRLETCRRQKNMFTVLLRIVPNFNVYETSVFVTVFKQQKLYYIVIKLPVGGNNLG